MYEQGWTCCGFRRRRLHWVPGMAAGAVHGPWDPGTFQRMQSGSDCKNIAIGPIISDARASEAHTATFSDSKGIVIFRQQQGKKRGVCLHFFMRVLGEEHLNLVFWLHKDGDIMPARHDLLRNPVFADFFNTHPAARVF